MTRNEQIRRSKLMSLLLRHDPDRGGLRPDRGGWVDVEDLLGALERLGLPTDRTDLDEVVEHGSKPRFERRGERIRARYGHSIEVDLGYESTAPPARLYHGTASRRVDRILTDGIAPMGRQVVHLSADVATATEVGARHGDPVVLVVDSARMAADGHVFYEAAGGTWLIGSVASRYVLGPADDVERD